MIVKLATATPPRTRAYPAAPTFFGHVADVDLNAVAESIGDLIYGHDSTVRNLRSVLEREFEVVRSDNAGKSAALALLFRHALAHQDELQSLQTGGRELGWQLNYRSEAKQLQVSNHGPNLWSLRFDTTTFYEDTVAVCRASVGWPWRGAVMTRYNAWLTCDVHAATELGLPDATALIRGLRPFDRRRVERKLFASSSRFLGEHRVLHARVNRRAQEERASS
jgi:hypothetical protein